MDAPVEHASSAWQPITPRGVAAFAHSSPLRLRLAQIAVALLVVSATLWFISGAWYPVVDYAIAQMPSSGGISRGVLNWPGTSPARLGENRFLSIAVDLDHEGLARSPAHVQIEFGRRQVKLFSLFGYIEREYDPRWLIPLSRPETQPWWGAWSPMILVISALLVIVALFASWTVLAAIYMPLVSLIAFFANRDLSITQSWRLSSATLLPGALIMVGIIFVYGLGAWDLPQLGLAVGLHLLVGWIYVFYTPFLLPRTPKAHSRANPFKK